MEEAKIETKFSDSVLALHLNHGAFWQQSLNILIVFVQELSLGSLSNSIKTNKSYLTLSAHAPGLR